MKRLYTLITICLLFLLAGCSGLKADREPEQTQTVSLGTDWQKTGFQLKSTIDAEYMEALNNLPMHEKEWQEITKDGFDTVSACMGDTLYLWHNPEKEGEPCILQTYFASEGKGENVEISLPEDCGIGRAVAMDVWENELSVLYREGESLWVFLTDRTGKVTEAAILETVEGQEEMPANVYDFYRDAQGYCYLFAGEWEKAHMLFIYDREGKCVLSEECTDEGTQLECTGFHTPDGSVVFLIPEPLPAPPVLLWYDMCKEQPVEVAKLDKSDRFLMTMREDGKVYMMTTSRLELWDVVTGKKEPLFNLLRSAIRPGAVKEIGVTPTGDVYLYLCTEGTWQVYRLSDEVQETDENTIRFANLTYDAVYEETQATVFSHKNPDTPVIIEKAGNDEAAFRDRIMAELAAGKGPDLMWVTMEDMEVLQEKGILMDLEMLIPKETLEQIFPGVLASGTVDGTLYGLFFDGCPKSFMVSDEIWSGNTWTVEDICSLLEEHKEVGDIYGAMREYTLNLFTENIRRCPFLDMDAGESYFEGEAFIRLLEYIKEFGDKEWEHTANKCELLKNRELLVAKAGVRKLSVFSRTMADCEAYSCHLVGLPGNDSDAGVWSNHEFLVVNSKTPHGEAVGKLFEYLLSEEAQKTTFDCSVRADVIRNTIRFFTMPDGEIIGEQSKEGNEVQTLVLKEDNTTYVEEYIEFLNRCEPSPYSATQIQRIIRDVLLEYLNDQYSAERAAEIIDNRVQLYLDEQK